MKSFAVLCFFFVVFVSSSLGCDKCNCCSCKNKCDKGYSYQAVVDIRCNNATYGCVPQNACNNGITNECNKCCANSADCVPFFFIRGEPFSRCAPCKTGIVNSCAECPCTRYGYTCRPIYRKFHGPVKYNCQPPQPRGVYDCRSFCPINSSCGMLYFKKSLPYFYCLQE